MHCEQLKKRINALSQKVKSDRMSLEPIVEHLGECQRCHRKYHRLLKEHAPDTIIPEPATIKMAPPASDSESGVADPVEFKDKPITFALVLDGRKEAIKVVEPEFDTPLPEESRLVIKDGDVCVADVQFSFELDREQPYALTFAVRGRRRFRPAKVSTFGPPGKNMKKVFREMVIDEGGILAEIEMTHGKARLHIQYHGG